ncbi:hypothetical protein GH714_027116 [Hevea brasiliensis]|uniref:Cytochrome P450 n=1 Tax=Hevea brasiliensis TaxID=3981 RepID=A0A6A6N2J1_HEVBR|nr:hypothetical protein GH714_027116 [Hevea brasiliensis]
MPHISMANHAKAHGPLISLRLGTRVLIVGSSPMAATEILKTNDRFLSGRCVPKANPYRSQELDRISLVWAPHCTEGWKSLRALCRTELFSAKAIESQASMREKKVAQMELFSAGTDTTTTTIEWAVAELIKNKLMRKVREELEREINKDYIHESNVSQLPYLNACIKETLRLHPPAPFLVPRRAIENCEVMNYTIPKDSQILVNVWATGRDPSAWEDPLLFKPERFLNSSLDLKGHDYEFLPFGSGRRICPGLPMATRQLPMILASLIHCFDWSLENNEDPAELNMTEKFGITLQKEHPLLIVPKKNYNFNGCLLTICIFLIPAFVSLLIFWASGSERER